MSNRYKIEEEEVDASAAKKEAGGIKSVLTGSFLSKERVVNSLPFIFFMTFLGICYIANGYQIQKVVVGLHKTKNEVKELRSEYITTKSELMILSKQSEVAAATAEMGLKELTSPPKKIVITNKEKQQILND